MLTKGFFFFFFFFFLLFYFAYVSQNDELTDKKSTYESLGLTMVYLHMFCEVSFGVHGNDFRADVTSRLKEFLKFYSIFFL